MTSPTRTAEVSEGTRIRPTLDNLEVWDQSSLEDGFAEHGAIRDDTGEENDNDEVFVDLLLTKSYSTARSEQLVR